VHSAFKEDWGQAIIAFSLPTVVKMQIDVRRPFDLVLLVNGNVVVVALEEGFGGAFDLNPRVTWNDIVFAELGVVDHDAQAVFTDALFHRDFDKQIMVAVANVGNFNIVSAQFLCDFLAIVDAVLDKTAAFDFPAVIDAATGGKACCDERNENFKKNRVHLNKIKMFA